jgi:anti-sigma factor RsiW
VHQESSMSDCRDVEPLMTPYVDGEAQPAERASVDAHIKACPPCREAVADERTAREVLHARREELRASAPEMLRRRCAAQTASMPRSAAAPRPSGLMRRSWLPLSLAATLVLTIAAVFLYGLNNRVEALAAQLAVDHVKCFQFVPDHSTVDPGAAGLAWARTQGWALRVPSSAPDRQLVLLDVRRCWSTDGITAHMLYRWRGEPLSVYVLNGVPARSFEVRTVDKLGQEEIMWSRGGRTYAIVARGRRADLQQVVAYVQQSVE